MLKSRETYVFGAYRLDASGRVLYLNDRPLPLPPKQIDTLVVLVRAGGEVVDRESLVSQVWPDTFVEEGGLTRNVSMLRKAIEGPGETYIETIPKRGYRFIAPVTREAPPADIVRVVERITEIQVDEETIVEAPQPPLALAAGPSRRWLRPLAIAAMLGLVGVAALSWRRAPADPTRLPEIRSLAVLPFRHLNPEPADRHLGVGLADALITRFANLSSLVVLPTTTVLAYGGDDAISAGRALGVDAVLDGSIRRSGGQLRITVQLLDVATGRPQWAGSFDDSSTELLAVEANVAEAVAGLLVPGLGDDERRRFARRDTTNAVAWQAYLRGRALWATRGAPELEAAIREFEAAIASDPGYAPAYAGLAQALMAQSSYQYRWARDVQPQAKAAATRALELDPLLADAHGILGGIAFTYDWDWATADREIRRGIALNPNEAALHQLRSNYLMAMGHLDQSVEEATTAVRLDPMGFAPNANLVLMLNWARRFDESVAQAERAMQMNGVVAMPALQASASHYLMGRQAEAVALFERARAQVGEIPVITGFTARYAAVAGRRDQARVILQGLEQRYGKEIVEPIFIAAPWVNIGDADRAFRWLRQAVSDRSAYAPYIAIDPSFDALHDDPRFAELMTMMGLDEVFARVRR